MTFIWQKIHTSPLNYLFGLRFLKALRAFRDHLEKIKSNIISEINTLRWGKSIYQTCGSSVLFLYVCRWLQLRVRWTPRGPWRKRLWWWLSLHQLFSCDTSRLWTTLQQKETPPLSSPYPLISFSISYLKKIDESRLNLCSWKVM